ncbi:MAG TPA: pilus assembly protein TadG-related protein [Terracidiphilus sp.]|jgi:hypothetical protein|nr:pilus assembly protein TadG-related protein [Terracidiphilus sp.]
MKLNLGSKMRRLIWEESGQILPWAIFLFAFLLGGLGALVVDVGRGVVAQRLLQASADAAAMAGAQSMGATISPSQATIQSQACKFGGQSASSGNCTVVGNNANTSLMPSAVMASGYPSVYCSSTLASAGLLCSTITTSGAAVTGNTVKVVETEALPTWFGAMIGIPKLNLTAAAMAAMRGSPRNPYNVAIVIDTTASMNSTDGKTSNCSGTRVSCALEGALTLLGDLSPCASGGTCGSVVSGTLNVKNPIDEVAIYTFPGLVSTTAASNDSTCSATMKSPGGSGATISYYTYPTLPVYQVVGFSSNYASQDPSSSNSGATNSNLQPSKSTTVDAVGGQSGCAGIQAVGGASTYYAGVIYQAQADLVSQYNTRLAAGQQTQNVMIVISDGDAEAGSGDFGTSTINTASTTYPSYFNECQQAVTAAQAATAAGTTVYTIAYGTQSSGCNTDQSGYSVTVSGKKYTNPSPSGLGPCTAMQDMASNSSTFYSDYVAGGNGGSNDPNCTGASQTDTSINDIFSFIASNLSEARLVPWGTT